ncbi:hypothetical protein ACRQ1B_15695 [Rhizobium panacihumi]|uniref:hypothetical protein n=1 Tax=Rhizobium panacihumi TaxID=2008450 RepID=UPI003D7BC686
MFPLKANDDIIVAFGVVTNDLTNQKAEEARPQSIIFEAAHRMKNTLAIVEAAASQTL